MSKEVTFPPSASVPEQPQQLQCDTSIVVVGANGAGKSRLGAWLEFKGPQKDRVHRIAAQRSLKFPDNASPIALTAAKNAFHWAPIPQNWSMDTYEQNKATLRVQARYGGSMYNAETAPLDDFSKLVTLLFSENYSTLLAHEELQKSSGQLIPIPESILRKVQSLWESLLPHRALRMESSEVRVIHRTAPEKDYSARAMSDGERVIFYLIGQCLCAPTDAIIVIDEPEIHLHKAIQDALWNAVEKSRPDCTFVYLTHDLSFASDRSGATKVCVTAFTNEAFSWFSVSDQQEIPEDVFLEVLGSRKPVLFVEGTSGSHDASLYRLAFPTFTVKPVGGCAAVVSATKVFRALESLHHNESYGIVDRDYLDEGQINAYARAGIYVPRVAEVENLYLVPEILEAVAVQLMLDPQQVREQVISFVLGEFERWLPVHAMGVTQYQVNLMLGRFSSSRKSIQEYIQEFDDFRNTIDPGQIYATAFAEAQSAIAAKDYKLVLRLFNKKDLTANLGRFFGLAKGTYVEKVKAMAKRGVGNIPELVRKYVPDFQHSSALHDDRADAQHAA